MASSPVSTSRNQRLRNPWQLNEKECLALELYNQDPTWKSVARKMKMQLGGVDRLARNCKRKMQLSSVHHCCLWYFYWMHADDT